MSSVPIADHGLLSNCRSAALVTRDGSVEWLCLPRFDSPSVFGRLLDDGAGHWSIRPAGTFRATRRYVTQSMVLQTTFETARGAVTCTDALALGPGTRGHRLGEEAPSLIIRQVQGVTGKVDLEVDYAPRTEYGLVAPLLSAIDGGLLGRGGADITVLSSPVALQIGGGSACGRFTIRAGERLAFALHHGRPGEPAPLAWSAGDLAMRLDDTVAAWQSWSRMHQGYQGPWRELVHVSGRVLGTRA